MFKSLAKASRAAATLIISALATNALLAVLIFVGAFWLAPSSAHAELKPLFNELLLYNSPQTLPTIEVEAEGQEWTRVSTKSIHVTASYYVSLNKGGITSITAFVGFIQRTRAPGGGERRWGEFSFAIPGGNLGFAITACNKEKQSGANTGETHTIFAQVPALLRVSAKRGGNSATRDADGNVQARIVCKKAPKLVEIRDFAVEVDNSTEKCPKNAVVQVSFSTNRPDRIDFVLRHRNAGSVSTSEHSAQPFTIGGQYVAQETIDLVVDSNTEYVEVQLKDGSDSQRWRTTGPLGTPINCSRAFKVTSLWLTYDVENKETCPKNVVENVTGKATAPGKLPFEIKTQGGLVVHSGTADFKLKGMEYVAEFGRDNLVFSNAFESDMMALIKGQAANSGWVKLKVDCVEALSGKLTLNSLGDTSCKGEALVAIHTDGAGELPYELECGPGKSWQRTVMAMANKIGVDKVRFNVTNNEQVTCILRTRIGGVLKSLDGASKTFQCHKPTDTGASTDLVPDTRPDAQKPDMPAIVVIDPVKPDKPDEPEGQTSTVSDPKISCANGKVKGDACECEPHFKPVKAGKNTWRCVRSTVDPKPEKPIVSEPTISCALGVVKNGTCNCQRTHKPVKAGKKAWRCVKTVVDPPRNKESNKANKFEVKTAPKRTAAPKLGASGKGKGGKGKGKGKTAKKGNGSSAPR